jgi:hypothetical protein
MAPSSILPQHEPVVPQLIPVFLLNLKISPDPTVIYKDSVGDRVLNLGTVVDGQAIPIENSLGLKFELNSITGFDDITETVSLGISRLDCKLYGKTPGGAGVQIKYPGVIKLLEPTVNVFLKKSTLATFEESYVVCNPTFTCDSSLEPEYKWVQSEQFNGKGRFIRDESGTLYVQYYIYVVR